MRTVDDGGAAFPTFEEIEHWDRDSEKYRESIAPLGGMSLRDYFAAKALPLIRVHDGQPDELVAESCYRLADAMLKAREAK